MSTARKKIDVLNMRVEPTQKQLLERAAEASGHQSVTAFVLEHALQAAHRELDEVRNYSLSLRDARAFLVALESPPKPNLALKSLFSNYDKKYSKAKR